jgi:orotidine-5'-phosphate decarboxylase
LAEEYEFLIMQDSKFSDVPKIVYKQLTINNPYDNIACWADYVTIQPLNYLDTIDYIQARDPTLPVTLVCVAEMNTQNSFSKDPRYLAIVKDLVIQNRKQIPSIVSQSAFADIDLGGPSECLRMTPGVCIDAKEAGPRYRTIEDAISRDKNHIVIIGESLINKHKKLMTDPTTYADNMTAMARDSYSCFVATHGF